MNNRTHEILNQNVLLDKQHRNDQITMIQANTIVTWLLITAVATILGDVIGYHGLGRIVGQVGFLVTIAAIAYLDSRRR